MSDSTDLTAMPSKADLPKLFSEDGGIEGIIKRIEDETKDIVFDVSTAKGRKDARSLASKVSRSKTLIDTVGKELNEERNRLNKEVNEVRNLAKDRLDELRDRIKKPVEDWEETEADRVRTHQKNLGMFETDQLNALAEPDELKALITRIEAVEVDATWDEFQEEGETMKAEALKKYQADYSVAKERADQAAELEKFKADAAERDRKEQERLEAEEAEKQRLAEEQQRAEQEKLRAEQAERAAEQARIEAIEVAKREQREAEERHQRELKEAEDKRKRDLQAERDRIEAKRREEAVEAERRKHDLELREKTAAEIMKALSAVEPRNIKTMIEAMIDGEIPHVTVTF